MRVSRDASTDSGGRFEASKASQRRLNGDLGMKTQEEEEEEVVMVVVRGRGGPCWRSVVVAVFLVLACITGSAEGQCDGSPLYLAPDNSSLHVAFPEVNWDAHSGTWSPYQYYPTSVHCTWVVRAPAAHVLVAMFVQFDTEQDYDFVTIYGSEARTEQLLRVSGDLTGDWLVTSPEDTLVIDFVSDEYTTYAGFQLAYRYEPRACVDGGVTVTEDQLIALPTLNLRGVLPGPGGVDAALSPAAKSKPKKLQTEVPKGGARWQVRDGGSWVARAQYPIWVNCTWRVAVSQRQVVELEVLRFNTPERDLLKVWEVGVGGARPLLQHGGGDVPQRRSFRSSRPLLITFLAQSGEGGVGFLLDLTYITRACDPPVQVLGAPRGLVGYPHYNLLLGDGGNQQGSLATPAWRTEERQEDHGRGDSGGAVHYGPDSCKWVMRAPTGYTLNLTVLHLDTRPQDPIKVVEGDALVFALRGSVSMKKSFVSQGSEVTLKFDPEEDTDKTGFLLQYSWLLEKCGGEVKVEGSGQIKSPFYPDTYGPNVTCQWKLTPPPGHLLHLLITRLKLDAGDSLQVTDGDKDLKVTWDPSNPASRLLELRPGPSVSLFFSSDSQRNDGYFLIKYAAFTLGSCGFDLSPCGWTTMDPLQAWAFHPSQGMMVVTEDSPAGLQLPRGYRAILVSPWVTPLADTPSTTTDDDLEHVCLKFDYLLEGPDTFLLSAWLVQKDSDHREVLSTSPLANVYGPHGNRSLTAAVNFTVPATASFRVLMRYERGYGPDYRAGVGGVWVGRGKQCGRELDHLRATSCNFTKDLCGWTNTHTDHTNWLLTEHGVEAVVHGGSEDSEQQWADLISPAVSRGELRQKEEQEKEGEEGKGGAACLNLLYRMFSGNTDLRVALRRLSAAGTEGGQEEEVLWSQGRVESPGVLQAFVNLPQVLPSQYQLVLRAVGVSGSGERGTGGGVAVQAARLEAGRCSGGASCSFDHGFCSWKVSYTGGTVWYIKPHQGEEGSHAAVLVGGAPGDSTCLISETVPSSAHARAFTFRYKVTGTTRCLSVLQRAVSDRGTAATTNTTTTTTTITTIWSQCRGKGDHWLYECVTLPPSALPYEVVLKATADEDSTEVWIDDVQLSSGTCNSTLPQDTLGSSVYGNGFGSYSPLNSLTLSSGLDTPSFNPGLSGPPQWRCEPRGSLCGMTQPSTGLRDWVYVETTRPGLHLNASSTTPIPPAPTTTTTTTPRPGASEQSGQLACRDGSPLQEEWFCDGVEDCPDRSDEEDCECVKEPGQKTCRVPSSNPNLNLGSGVCALDAFKCPTGRACPPGGCEAGAGPCIPRAWLCDGVEHCLGGEDEAACVGVSRPAPRETANEVVEPHPVPTAVDMAAAAAAAAARAAIETSPEITTSEAAAAAVVAAAVAAAATKVMECSGGLLVPQTWRCDGRKDCPLDGLDEVGCAYCSTGEFICPHSGVCVPRGQVCDGAASISSCSDELFCEACPPAHFACDVCVPSWQICDGVWNCENGEDERKCTGLGVGLGMVEAGMRVAKKCEAPEPYRCPSGLCLPESALCDRHLDCPDGDDEKHCLDDNFDVPRYLSVSVSPVSRGQLGGTPSRLVTPPLEQPAGMAGVLAFRYRLDAWTGPSNLTLTVEVVDAEDSSEGVRAWALWRQSGHKGREWLTESVLVPPMPGVTKYKLAFLLTDHHHHHYYDSQQVHLSHLSFRATQPRALNPLGAEMLSCEFADSLCGWSQPSVHHGYSWVYARASPHTRRTGPITGYPGEGDSGFVFADSLYGSEGSTADLLSPPLMLPDGPEKSICFRFALFLYGSQVSQVSVLALQHLPSGTHSTQLYKVAGGRGLSWVSVSVTVRPEHLEDVSLPLVLAVRARRGPGPEGDIALDHLSVLAGPCHLHPSLQPNITLHPTLAHPDALALTAGPTLTPLPARDPPDDPAHPSEDSCSASNTCSSCVSGQGAGVQACTWCDLTLRCVGSRSPAAAACPRHLAVHHNTSEAEERRGPGWCPQLTPQQNTRVLVAAGSSPVLSFSVNNIQATQTDSSWSCVFESIEEDEEEEEGKREEEEEGKTQLEGQGKGRPVEGNEDTEEERKLKEEEENIVDGGESEFDFKRKRREEKRSAEEVKKVTKEALRLPGFFQGRVFTVGGPSGVGVGVREGVGVGVIRCGDGVSELRPVQPRPRALYAVKLLSPAGAAIDNPARVKLEMYSCGQLSSSSCPSCVAVNASYTCGWCVVAQSCTIHAHCPGASWVGHGRSCDLEEQRKTQGEDAGGLGMVGEELLGLGEPLHHLGEHAKSDLDLDLAGGLLGGADQPSLTRDEEEDEDETKTSERRRGNKRKKAQQAKNGGSEAEEEEAEEEGEDGDEDDGEENTVDDLLSDPGPKRGRGKKRAGRKSLKGKLKVTGRGRSFLRLPQHPGLYVARDTWRLHTGRQYYIPVSRKTLVNLGFVRQVTFGSLAQEKTRTVLINGTWKKAAGYYVDLYEKVDNPPVTSLITTSRSVFEQLMAQLSTEQ